MLRAFMNRSSRRLFSFHFTGNTVPTLGLLIFDYQHVFGVSITLGGGGGGGGGGVFLEPGRIGRLPPRLSGLASSCAFYQFGIIASGLFFVSPFFVVLLVEW